MQLLDYTYPNPAENLACDEVLLDECDAGQRGGVLRFWESSKPFVVVGYGNRIASEVHHAVCEKRGIPIFRRCSGGGTVVQGPGCLNYAVVLRIDSAIELASVACTNKLVMERNRLALQSLIPDLITIQGHTDLAIEGIKFSGNAQRRRKHALLFHGTVLLHFDLLSIDELLPLPSQQPGYRQSRTHRDFVRSFPASVVSVKDALVASWKANMPGEPAVATTVQRLVADRYSQSAWNFNL